MVFGWLKRRVAGNQQASQEVEDPAAPADKESAHADEELQVAAEVTAGSDAFLVGADQVNADVANDNASLHSADDGQDDVEKLSACSADEVADRLEPAAQKVAGSQDEAKLVEEEFRSPQKDDTPINFEAGIEKVSEADSLEATPSQTELAVQEASAKSKPEAKKLSKKQAAAQAKAAARAAAKKDAKPAETKKVEANFVTNIDEGEAAAIPKEAPSKLENVNVEPVQKDTAATEAVEEKSEPAEEPPKKPKPESKKLSKKQAAEQAKTAARAAAKKQAKPTGTKRVVETVVTNTDAGHLAATPEEAPPNQDDVNGQQKEITATEASEEKSKPAEKGTKKEKSTKASKDGKGDEVQSKVKPAATPTAKKASKKQGKAVQAEELAESQAAKSVDEASMKISGKEATSKAKAKKATKKPEKEQVVKTDAAPTEEDFAGDAQTAAAVGEASNDIGPRPGSTFATESVSPDTNDAPSKDILSKAAVVEAVTSDDSDWEFDIERLFSIRDLLHRAVVAVLRTEPANWESAAPVAMEVLQEGSSHRGREANSLFEAFRTAQPCLAAAARDAPAFLERFGQLLQEAVVSQEHKQPAGIPDDENSGIDERICLRFGFVRLPLSSLLQVSDCLDLQDLMVGMAVSKSMSIAVNVKVRYLLTLVRAMRLIALGPELARKLSAECDLDSDSDALSTVASSG